MVSPFTEVTVLALACEVTDRAGLADRHIPTDEPEGSPTRSAADERGCAARRLRRSRMRTWWDMRAAKPVVAIERRMKSRGKRIDCEFLAIAELAAATAFRSDQDLTMPTLNEMNARFTEELRHVDDVAQIVLKGHLVIEELMTQSLETFLLHKEFLEDARLQFHQKLLLCRALSTSDHNNNMWNLVAAINSVRNHLSHSLDFAARAKRIEKLYAIYAAEFPRNPPAEVNGMSKESATCMLAVAGVLGFLHGHHEEISRLKGVIIDMDIFNGGKLATADSSSQKGAARAGQPKRD
jgi:hypothetical protein